MERNDASIEKHGIKMTKKNVLTGNPFLQPEKEIRLLTPSQVAEKLFVSVSTLAVWRTTKRYNLPYVKVGRLVRYRASDIAAFMNSREQGANNDL